MQKAIKRLGGIDLMVVGVGMNGHLGFNEPGVSEHLHAHVIDLDEITTSVGQKYFSTPQRLNQGITMGLRDFMASRTALMLINGTRKKEITQRLLATEPSTELPASFIKKHGDGILLMDREAGGK